MALCHINLHMSSVHAGRAGYGDTSWPGDETPGVSTSVPPPVPANPHASMDRIGSCKRAYCAGFIGGHCGICLRQMPNPGIRPVGTSPYRSNRSIVLCNRSEC
jgi:hypothetical protein